MTGVEKWVLSLCLGGDNKNLGESFACGTWVILSRFNFFDSQMLEQISKC